MGGARSAYGERRGVYRFWWGYLKERDHFGDPGVDGRIFRNLDVVLWTGLSWIRIGTGGGFL